MPSSFCLFLTNQVVGNICLSRNVCVLIDILEDCIHNPVEEVDHTLITDGGVAVQVVTIHDGIANSHEGNLAIAPQVLTVGVTDEQVYRLGEQQRTNAFTIR
jgi:hypothetical protein